MAKAYERDRASVGFNNLGEWSGQVTVETVLYSVGLLYLLAGLSRFQEKV